MFNDKETRELETNLAAIAAGRLAHRSSWNETKIGRYTSFSEDVERFKKSEEWWRHDTRGSRDMAAINELLERVGVGRLRSRDDDFERRRDAQKKENEKYNSTTPATEVADAEEKYLEYMPEPGDSAWAWVDALPTKVDVNTREKQPWYSALSSYVHKFPERTKARDLDQETLAKLVKQICEEASQ
jgi:hypothetical protein